MLDAGEVYITRFLDRSELLGSSLNLTSAFSWTLVSKLCFNPDATLNSMIKWNTLYKQTGIPEKLYEGRVFSLKVQLGHSWRFLADRARWIITNIFKNFDHWCPIELPPVMDFICTIQYGTMCIYCVLKWHIHDKIMSTQKGLPLKTVWKHYQHLLGAGWRGLLAPSQIFWVRICTFIVYWFKLHI